MIEPYLIFVFFFSLELILWYLIHSGHESVAARFFRLKESLSSNGQQLNQNKHYGQLPVNSTNIE